MYFSSAQLSPNRIRVTTGLELLEQLKRVQEKLARLTFFPEKTGSFLQQRRLQSAPKVLIATRACWQMARSSEAWPVYQS